MKRDLPPAPGPVAMSPTSQGTVYLYEMRDGDWPEYARRPEPTAMQRVRWLMSRIASGSAAQRATMTPSKVASFSDDDIEALMEVYLASPASQWQSTIRRDAGEGAARQPGETAVAYFDRLAQWRVPIRMAEDEPLAAVSESLAGQLPPPVPGTDTGTRQLLSWVSAGLAITVLLSAAGLGFAAMSYFEAKGDHRANEAWRAETHRADEAWRDEIRGANEAWRDEMTKLASQRRVPGSEKAVAELAAENARLRERIDALEARSQAASHAAAPAKPSTKPSPPKRARSAWQLR